MLYEAMALGRRTEQQFTMLTSGYEEKQNAHAERIDSLGKEIKTSAERKVDVSKFIAIVSKPHRDSGVDLRDCP